MTTAPWETPVDPKPVLPAGVVDHMVTSIRTQLVDARYDDPALAPQLIDKTLTELGRAIGTEGQLGVFAADLLQALWHRAETGIPYGEPAEPAYMETLDEDERRGF